MSKIILIAGLTLAIAGATTQPAAARGCVKGALVGGVAGHFAGHHPLLGAAAGCAVGHHMAHREDQRVIRDRQTAANDHRYTHR